MPTRLYAALYAIGLLVYAAFAWDRIGQQSIAPHFVYQADAWLHGQAAIDPPLVESDWAKIETVMLDDGSEVRGRRLFTRARFRTLAGDELPAERLRQTRRVTWYMSFPPLPTLLMLPSAALSGRAGNDVIPTLLVAAAILPLMLLVLRRLNAAGLCRRGLREQLWLVATLAFGSVMWFAAVQGSVWYTSHVVCVALALVYAWASIEAQRPIIAGLALAAAALTRPAMAFAFPLFMLEALRIARGHHAQCQGATFVRALSGKLVRFATPIFALAIPAMIYNAVRFGSPTEFGHTYLDVSQQMHIEQYGLASYHYLARNLAVAFTLLPEFPDHSPWLQVGGHGLALWLTTPVLVLALWPRERTAIHRPLWIAVVCTALPSLFYQNSGWGQFGYRFSLDYMVFLIMLLATGGRELGRVAKALIIAGIVVNAFGAVTFGRFGWRYYRFGANAYDVVVPVTQ